MKESGLNAVYSNLQVIHIRTATREYMYYRTFLKFWENGMKMNEQYVGVIPGIFRHAS